MQQTLEKFRQTVSVFLISIIVGFASGSAVIASEVESDLEGAMRSTIPAPNLKVSSWLLMDAKTGLTLAANNPDAPVEPASHPESSYQYRSDGSCDSGNDCGDEQSSWYRSNERTT